MKILWVKAGGLVPLDTGGKIRSYQILKALARRHSVNLFTFYAATPIDHHSQLRQEFTRVTCLPLNIPKRRTLREAIGYGRRLLSGLPYTISKFSNSKVERLVRQLISNDLPDIVVCDFVFAANAIPWDISIPKILFAHNVEASIWKHHWRLAENHVWKAICRREYRTMERFERLCINQADHVLTVSEHDRGIFSQMIDGSRISVIPTGVDVNYFRPSPESEKPNTIVFSGSMDYMPNEDGILYFMRHIWPHIREQIPGVSLCVVGRRPSRRLMEFAKRQNGIQITGDVDDIRPYVHRSSVYIVPLRIGSGTRLKIFEAMAMGKAIVSTTIGAEGLPIQDGREIVLADEPEEFARAVGALLQDQVRRRQLGQAARELVEHKYSWNSVARNFEIILETLVATGRNLRVKHPGSNTVNRISPDRSKGQTP